MRSFLRRSTIAAVAAAPIAALSVLTAGSASAEPLNCVNGQFWDPITNTCQTPRPAQDCGPGYGNAVVFNEVLELGPTVYRERQLSRLAPRLKRQVAGCHTYNVYGGVEVLDILGRQPSSAARLQVFEGGENGDSERGELPDRSGPMTSTDRAVPGVRPR